MPVDCDKAYLDAGGTEYVGLVLGLLGLVLACYGASGKIPARPTRSTDHPSSI